ncbi:MAG: putative sulfate exporter family transporter, partial [Halieaceae bacterium]
MIPAVIERWQRFSPGVGVAAVVALAASFLANRYGAPAMLLGLLLGMAFNFLAETPKLLPGIDFSATQILRLGVALLGLRLTMDDLTALGWGPVVMVFTVVIATMLVGVLLARMLNVDSKVGILTGGAVGICGASAAMAISSALPQGPETKRQTLFTVIGVTALSTIAMVLYPVIGGLLQFSDADMGLFIGATIHDVAQVVGAGYSVSTEAGDLGTFVKLLRVAMLVPVVLVVGIVIRSGARRSIAAGRGRRGIAARRGRRRHRAGERGRPGNRIRHRPKDRRTPRTHAPARGAPARCAHRRG